MSVLLPEKDPDELLDYTINWAAAPRWVTDDTIVTSTWIVPDGLTGSDETDTDTTVTIWLMGGTEGTTYEIVNRITTAGGRHLDQTVLLPIVTQ